MRKILFLFYYLFAMSCCFAETTGYKIVTEEWAPYNYTENGKIVGITTEIVQAIMNQTNDSFPIEVLPSARSTMALSQQPKIIMYSLFRTKDRENKFKWVGPILEEGIFPYKLNEYSPSIETIADLKNVSRIICRQAGVVPNQLLSMGFKNLDMSATKSIQLYNMLLHQRAPVIIGDTDIGVKYYIKLLNSEYSVLKKIPIEIFRSKLYIAFSLDSDDSIVSAWNIALKKIRDSGELQKIISKYE